MSTHTVGIARFRKVNEQNLAFNKDESTEAALKGLRSRLDHWIA
jgi:hypothetical protein